MNAGSPMPKMALLQEPDVPQTRADVRLQEGVSAQAPTRFRRLHLSHGGRVSPLLCEEELPPARARCIVAP